MTSSSPKNWSTFLLQRDYGPHDQIELGASCRNLEEARGIFCTPQVSNKTTTLSHPGRLVTVVRWQRLTTQKPPPRAKRKMRCFPLSRGLPVAALQHYCCVAPTGGSHHQHFQPLRLWALRRGPEGISQSRAGPGGLAPGICHLDVPYAQ